MLKSGQTFNANTFFNNKLKMTEEKKSRVLDIYNQLSRFSYDRGTREGDFVLRERVQRVASEVDLQYKKIRTLSNYKGGDEDIFYDILVFFNDRYFENNLLEGHIDLLKQVMEQEDKIDHDEKTADSREHSPRTINTYMGELDRDLKEWEKILRYNAEPLLFAFLNDLNEIILFSRINVKIGKLFMSDDVFVRSGPIYDELKHSISFFVIMHMKLTMIPLSEKEMAGLINRELQVMGFRDIILSSRNINETMLSEIYDEIIKDNNLPEHARAIKNTKKLAIDLVREKSGSLEKFASVPQEIAAVLEDLVYLENISENMEIESVVPVTDLAKKDKERYLFHVPGTFDPSLKFISEYLRNSLVFVLDWLQKEFQKNPGLAAPFQSFIECIPEIKEFARVYRMGLEMASVKSNQVKTAITGKEKQFVTKSIARQLIMIIEKNCKNIKMALIDVSYKTINSAFDRTGMLDKKLNIMKDAYGDSHNKIMKGLNDIERI